MCTKLVYLQDHANDCLLFRSHTSHLFHRMYIHYSCTASQLLPACKPARYEKDEIANSFDKEGKRRTIYKARP
jgi:hypothetical protein